MSGRTDLKVGFACNNRCVFCAQGDKRGSAPQVPRDELLQRLAAAFRPGRGLVLTGGEPTMRRDLARLVRAARALGYAPVQLQTNGRMLCYGDVLRTLLAAGVTEISPALHGPDPAVHDALTRAPGSFDQTARGIVSAVARGVTVVTNTVVQRGNLHVLGETVDVLADLGVRQAQLAMVHPVGSAAEHFEEVVPTLAAAAPSVAAAVRRGHSRGMRVVVEALPLCFARGIEDAVVEARIPETTVVDLDGDPRSFSDWRRDEGKRKGPPCLRCVRRRDCEGPWREYPEAFGWDEFEPFLATP